MKEIDKRERRKTLCVLELGEIKSSAIASDITAGWYDGMRIHDEDDSPPLVEWKVKQRVPVLTIDQELKVYYFGLRRVSVNGTVSIGGRSRKPDMVRYHVQGKGDYWFAVFDDSPTSISARYFAPWPLETKEHAKRYFELGIDGNSSGTQVANLMQWKGAERTSVGARFAGAVVSLRNGGSKTYAMSMIPDVTFPSQEFVRRSKTWEVVGAEIDLMQKTVDDMKSRFGTIETNAKQAFEISTRNDRWLDEMRKDLDRMRLQMLEATDKLSLRLTILEERVDDLILG